MCQTIERGEPRSQSSEVFCKYKSFLDLASKNLLAQYDMKREVKTIKNSGSELKCPVMSELVGPSGPV
jgi:hypothetical protein